MDYMNSSTQLFNVWIYGNIQMDVDRMEKQ